MATKRDTKNIIMLEALNLFAIHGYESVSIRDIGKVVGIKESSIYNHYKNKQDIFDSIVEVMSKKYIEAIGQIGMPDGDGEHAANEYEIVSEQKLLNMSTKMFEFFLTNEYATKYRHMLTIEQFNNTVASQTFKSMFIDNVLEFQAKLFDKMIEDGYFCRSNSYVMAMQFYAPIFLLLSKYDNQLDKREEAYGLLEEHVRQFGKLYTKK